MTDQLIDMRQFLDAPKLTLPIGGRDFVVQQVTAKAWMRLQEIFSLSGDATAAAGRIDDPDAPTTDEDTALVAAANEIADVDLFRLALGPAFDELIEHVTADELSKAGTTAWFWQIGQRDLAVQFWQSGGKAPGPTSAPSSTSTSTDAATTTRKRASTTTTRSPRKSKPAKPAAR